MLYHLKKGKTRIGRKLSENHEVEDQNHVSTPQPDIALQGLEKTQQNIFNVLALTTPSMFLHSLVVYFRTGCRVTSLHDRIS